MMKQFKLGPLGVQLVNDILGNNLCILKNGDVDFGLHLNLIEGIERLGQIGYDPDELSMKLKKISFWELERIHPKLPALACLFVQFNEDGVIDSATSSTGTNWYIVKHGKMLPGLASSSPLLSEMYEGVPFDFIKKGARLPVFHYNLLCRFFAHFFA
jgi:hypothetical protein